MVYALQFIVIQNLILVLLGYILFTDLLVYFYFTFNRDDDISIAILECYIIEKVSKTAVIKCGKIGNGASMLATFGDKHNCRYPVEVPPEILNAYEVYLVNLFIL